MMHTQDAIHCYKPNESEQIPMDSVKRKPSKNRNRILFRYFHELDFYWSRDINEFNVNIAVPFHV